MQRSAYGRLNATLISHALMTTPTTSFPRRPAAPFPHPRKSNTPPLRHSRKGGNPHPSPVIPAKAGIHTHHPSFPRKPTPSFPQRRESKPIIRHSREGGNPQFPRMREFNENTIQTDQTPHSHTGPPQRHSRKSGNPHPSPVIPAETYSVIPAKAGIHKFPRMREFIVPLLQCPKNTPSFPRRRESTIPAHAGIQRKHHPD